MTELTLKRGVPTKVTPSGSYAVVQNPTTTTDDMLLVSQSGDIDGRWMEVGPLGSVKFDQPMFLMQKAWTTLTLPVIEGA